MAQLNRDGLAFALGRLYLSRGGSESDLNDVVDSADIVAKLYHLLGGNEATPKGTTMAELVNLLSTTQGGSGGFTFPVVYTNEINDNPIFANAMFAFAFEPGEETNENVVGNFKILGGSEFYVMADRYDDSKDSPFFAIDMYKISTVYSEDGGGYIGTVRSDLSLGELHPFTISFNKLKL